MLLMSKDGICQRGILLLASVLVLSTLFMIAPIHAQEVCQAEANLVLGQPDFASWGANRTPDCMTPDCQGPPEANTLSFDDARFAFDFQGNIWVSDKENNRVLRFDQPFSNGMDATIVLGQRDFFGNIPNAFGAFDSDRSFRGACSQCLGSPWGMAFDAGEDNIRSNSDDRLWVVDRSNARLLRFDPPFETAMAASAVLGQANFTNRGANRSISGPNGRRHPWANGFDDPADITIDSEGNIWVADRNNSRVVMYRAPIDTSGPIPGTYDRADLVLGQPDFESRGANRGNGKTVVANGFYDLRAIVVGQDDTIWIVDNDAERVIGYKPPFDFGAVIPGANEMPDFILGQPDFTSFERNRGSRQDMPVPNGFGQPTGIAVDLQGNLWIVERSNRRVVRYSPPFDETLSFPGSEASANYVLGQPDLTSREWGEGQPNAKSLGDPNGVGIDLDGNVWTMEHNNDRVMRFPCNG